VEVNGRFGGTYSLHLQGRTIRQTINLYEAHNKHSSKQQALLASCFMLVSPLSYSSVILEAICFSETSVDFNGATWSYIPEDITVYIHRGENLKSNITVMLISIYHIMVPCFTRMLHNMTFCIKIYNYNIVIFAILLKGLLLTVT
jgi:hypothetical protein